MGVDGEARTSVERRNQALVKALGEVVYEWRPLTAELRWDGDYTRILGYSTEEMGSDTAAWVDRIHPEDLPKVKAELEAAQTENRLFQIDYRFRHRDGSYLWMNDRGVLSFDGSGVLQLVIGVFRDITQQKRDEQRIWQLNRTYSVLTDIDKLIVHQEDPQRLLDGACRVAVENGGFLMAWIGLASAPDQPLTIVAHAGASPDTLTLLETIIRNPQMGCRITAHALATGAHTVCNDIEHDPEALEWRDAALQRGYRAMVALPLVVAGRIAGTVNLYSGEAGFFDREELRLLEELAMDISFALDVSRREKERHAADERIARQRSALIALTSRQRLDHSDVIITLREIAEAAARTLGVGRVSIWRYNQDRSGIECSDLFELDSGRHSSGATLAVSTYPAYFRALSESEFIAAEDAANDPQTCEFAIDYLRPLGIGAMLDAPISVGGVRAGVLCHEHVGPPRKWAEDEKTFAVAMANLVSLAIESAQRREAETAQRESEERFRQLAENIHEVFWITDPQKKQVLYISPAYERIWDRTCASLYHDSHTWFDAIHPDDRSRVWNAAMNRQTDGDYDEEFRILHSGDGVRWIRDKAFPVHNAAGVVERIVGVAEDITVRKTAEAELQRREKRFRSLIEDASDLITVLSGEGVIDFQSPSSERILGYTAEKLIGSNLFDLVHPDDIPPAKGAMQHALINPSAPVSIEFRVRHHDSRWRTLQCVGRSMHSNTSQGSIVLNSRDVTESRTLEEQFRQSQKMEAIGQLAGGVAHDFNNILAAMMMQAELATLCENLPSEARDYLQDIKAAAERAANLTRQLLAFSRRQVMQPRQLDLNEIVTSVTKMLQRILGEDIRLQLHLNSRSLMIHADAGMLDQVLLNLVVNARDAMPGGGQLIIETTERNLAATEAHSVFDISPGRYAFLSVTDTGAGIAPQNLSHIFEPFFTTKEPGKGTGLGLATVFGIVKQHGGTVHVSSEVGRGSTFTILLPALEAAAVPLSIEETRTNPRGGSETILVVEDEPGVRMLTRIILERSGYTVLEAAHGVEALRIWDQHTGRIHLLLTDIVMPEGIGGRELATRLRESDPGLRVVFTSGYSADIAGRELTLDPGQNFIQKPSRPQDLLATVRQCLDN